MKKKFQHVSIIILVLLGCLFNTGAFAQKQHKKTKTLPETIVAGAQDRAYWCVFRLEPRAGKRRNRGISYCDFLYHHTLRNIYF